MAISLQDYYQKIRKNVKTVYRKAATQVDKRPLTSFFAILASLVLLIVISNVLRRPSKITVSLPETKQVDVYRIGTAPKINLQAQIDKAGVIQVTALTGGIIQNIYVQEGATVKQGQWLLSLSSNYQGGNALSVAREIAQKQNQNVEDSYPLQKDLIGKQRNLANQTESNFEQLRTITSQSVGDTQNLINLNNTIISSLDSSINALSGSSNASASAIILASQQMKSQFMSANLQLNNALRNAQYQSDTNNPPTQLAGTQKDIALQQLDIQEKALDLNREISKLQLRLAVINEGIMFPSAPFPSSVERVFVRVGQAVTPGTPLMTLSETIDPTFTATVFTSQDIAKNISRLEPSIIHAAGKDISVLPSYISREATQGNLYSIIYNLPQDQYSDLTDKDTVSIQLPLGYADTTATVPYIPLDAVYQTQQDAYVFVNDQGKARSKKVILGDVFGRFVRVQSGIESGDAVITNRNVVDGDAVTSK